MPIRPRLTRPPRILIASDQNHALSDVVRSLGRRGYSVLRVFAEATVLERARAARPDVVVLDGALAEGQSLDVSRALRADPAIGASTPILLLVAGRPRPRPTREDHLTALRAGVWELVRQPLNVSELLGKLDRYVLAKVERDGASRRDLMDDVTGLYSTHGLARRAAELIFQASRHNTSVACVALAPGPNGAAAADREAHGLDSLRGVARLLRASGRHSDAIGRIGPAEFAVVAAGVNRVGARQLAQRLRDCVGVELRAGYDAMGTRRAGGGTGAAGGALEARTLLARAARALELAKLEGKWMKEARE
jgi:two-component system cell cycle response regulator